MIEEPISEILAALPARISDVAQQWAEESPNHPALVEAAGTWTYGELGEVVAKTRDWLSTSGVRPGDRVMIVCENCRAMVATLLATASLDAWPVLVNAHVSAREADQIQEHCGARLLIYTSGISAHANEHAKRSGALPSGPASLGQIKIGPVNESENATPELLDSDIQNRVAALIYTSGTTGLPKGVMLTHRNVLYVAAVSAKIRSLTPQDRLYGILPMSHAVGLSVVLLGTLISGATLYISPQFDPMRARKSLENDQLTVVLGVPSMFAQFLQYAKIRKITSLKFPPLRIISCSGAPLHPANKAAVEQLFGLPLHNGYGITEAGPNIAQTSPEAPSKDTSVGKVLPGVEVRFLTLDGQSVPDGEVGEMSIRGPNIMKGYYRAPEDTAAAIDAEGWFNTRDLGRLENGNLFVVGRTKDLIICSGFNVYPAEVEAVLNSHSAVMQSAVIGRSTEGNEEVIAFVQPVLDATLTAHELEEYAAKHLAAYKRPSQILIVSAMPATASGKIAKAELKKIAENQLAKSHSNARLNTTLTSV